MRKYLESRQAVIVTKLLSGGATVTALAAVLGAGVKWHL
jgi:hypothetical protein